MENELNEKIMELSNFYEEKILKLRHELHADPELSFREYHTSERVKKLLEAMGLTVRSGIAKTGLTADMEGSAPGKTLLLRADMDALPLQEENELEYRSKNPGVMHACGHDVHTANLVGVAWILKELRPYWKGRVRFVFQPAEESGGGGREMIREGIMDDIHIDGSMALHTMPTIRPGMFSLGRTHVTSFSDRFRIIVHGKKTHSSQPHTGIDAIEIAAHIVVAVNGLLRNSVDPMERATYSIGKICGGTAPNIVPDLVEIEGMMRNVKAETRAALRERMEKVSAGIAESFGGSAEFIFIEGYSSVLNNEKMADFVKEKLEENAALWLSDIDPELSGEPVHLIEQKLPMLGAEDYGFYTQRVPSCFYRVGTGDAGKAHSPQFMVREPYIKLCTRSMASLAISYLNEFEGND